MITHTTFCNNKNSQITMWAVHLILPGTYGILPVGILQSTCIGSEKKLPNKLCPTLKQFYKAKNNTRQVTIRNDNTEHGGIISQRYTVI